jgi:hypothetical protein
VARLEVIDRKRRPSIAAMLRPRSSQYRWYCFGSASLPGAAADHPFHAEHSEKDH